MEGLLAFFLESTFIGLWLFGRYRLPPLVHTLCTAVSLGSTTCGPWLAGPAR
jgi:cytochrome bd ubiquinol oxidase subunit I